MKRNKWKEHLGPFGFNTNTIFELKQRALKSRNPTDCLGQKGSAGDVIRFETDFGSLAESKSVGFRS